MRRNVAHYLKQKANQVQCSNHDRSLKSFIDFELLATDKVVQRVHFTGQALVYKAHVQEINGFDLPNGLHIYIFNVSRAKDYLASTRANNSYISFRNVNAILKESDGHLSSCF